MSKKYKCGMCKKEIDTGNVCNDCSTQINEFVLSIKQRLKEAQGKNNNKN